MTNWCLTQHSVKQRVVDTALLDLCCTALQWVNAMLMEVWPFVDKAVCKKVKVRRRAHQSIHALCTAPRAAAWAIRLMCVVSLRKSRRCVSRAAVWVCAAVYPPLCSIVLHHPPLSPR